MHKVETLDQDRKMFSQHVESAALRVFITFYQKRFEVYNIANKTKFKLVKTTDLATVLQNMKEYVVAEFASNGIWSTLSAEQ